MLKHLKWPLFEHQRSFLKLIMFYKILHGLVDISFTLIPLSTPTRRHIQRFVTHFARTDTYINSFLPSAINLWNSLPDSLAELDDLNMIYPHTSSQLILCMIICVFIVNFILFL